jgi:SurA N-terminal domain
VKANRLVLLAAGGAAMLALSGCAQSGGVAARVGDTTVSTSDVDLLAKVQCASLDKAAKDPAQAGQVQAVPRATLRSVVVNALVDAEVNRQVASREHLSYDKAQLASAVQRYESTTGNAPEADRNRYRDLIETILRGQLQAIGRIEDQFTGQQPSNDEVQKAITDFEAKMRKLVDVEVNPQYGPDEHGIAGGADPSLSVAVSSFARHSRDSVSTTAQPDATWVKGLPAGQRCG